MRRLNVLIGCERSGRVRDAFLKLGHDAISCDIAPSESPGPHFQGDIRDIMYRGYFDIFICHPDCRLLALSGVRWLYNKDGSKNEARWAEMRDAALFFKEMLDAPIPRRCIENPVQHGHARAIIGPNFSQSIQPWQFGHGEIKRTCLWLHDLPKLEPSEIVDGRRPVVHHMPPTRDPEERRINRARTYPGIARAMAEQWGRLE